MKSVPRRLGLAPGAITNLRDDDVLPQIDDRLGEVFAPDRLDETLDLPLDPPWTHLVRVASSSRTLATNRVFWSMCLFTSIITASPNRFVRPSLRPVPPSHSQTNIRLISTRPISFPTHRTTGHFSASSAPIVAALLYICSAQPDIVDADHPRCGPPACLAAKQPDAGLARRLPHQYCRPQSEARIRSTRRPPQLPYCSSPPRALTHLLARS
jgi:hypothetical protein